MTAVPRTDSPFVEDPGSDPSDRSPVAAALKGDRASEEVFEPYTDLFRSLPFYEGRNLVRWLGELLEDPQVRAAIEMN